MPERTRPRAATAPDLISPAPVSGGSPACGSAAQGTGSYHSVLAPGPGTYAKNVLVNVVGWLRGHPRLGDGLLAAALLAFSVPQVAPGAAAGAPLQAAVTVVLAGTVILRRRYPVAAFGVAVAIGAAQVAFGVQYGVPAPFSALQPVDADLAILVLLYTLAAHRQRRVSIAGLAVCLLGLAVAIAR